MTNKMRVVGMNDNFYSDYAVFSQIYNSHSGEWEQQTTNGATFTDFVKESFKSYYEKYLEEASDNQQDIISWFYKYGQDNNNETYIFTEEA